LLLAGNPVFYKRTKHIAVVQLHSKQSLPRHITFVAIIFGINQDEEAYSEILEIVEETYEDMKWYKKWACGGIDFKSFANEHEGISHSSIPSSHSQQLVGKWFERYILDNRSQAPKKIQEKEIRELKFCLEVQDQKKIDGKMGFWVFVLYCPKW
jgi:hypothetical protein